MRRIILLALLLASCAPSETAIQTALAETLAANPTPTNTLTFTPSPTATATATRKPTNTAPPTNTPTFTALPATLTQAAIHSQATRTAVMKTSVALAKAATATEIASYLAISARELVTYPNAHIGERVKIRGRIFNINGDQELQIFLAGTTDAVYIVMDAPFSDIFEDDIITVYGVVDGESCGTNSFGSRICQPLILGNFYTIP